MKQRSKQSMYGQSTISSSMLTCSLTWTFFLMHTSYLTSSCCILIHNFRLLLRLLSTPSKSGKYAMRNTVWLHSRLLLFNVFPDFASLVRVNVENASVKLLKNINFRSNYLYWSASFIFTDINEDIWRTMFWKKSMQISNRVYLPDYVDSKWH